MSKNRNKNHKQSGSIVAQSQSISYSGPLPTPAHLAQYEDILPGAAERILKMAEDQSSHRRNLESKVINSGIADSRKGLQFGFLIGLSGFTIVGYCAYLGFQILAAIIAALDLGSLVGVFVYGSRQKKTERVEKEKAMHQANLKENMKFQANHQGKWVASKGKKIIADKYNLNKLMERVQKTENPKRITYTLVPKGFIA